MFLILFLFTWAAYVQSLHNMVPTRRHLSTNHRIAVTSVSLSSSSFDKDMTELSKLSRTELQTLSKEYGLKATLKTADLIINLEMAISSIDDSYIFENSVIIVILFATALPSFLFLNT